MHSRSIYQKLTHSFQRLQAGITLAMMAVLLIAATVAAVVVRDRLTRADSRIISTHFQDVYNHQVSAIRLAVSDVNRIYGGETMFAMSDPEAYTLSTELYTIFEYYLVSFPEIDGIFFIDMEGSVSYAGNITRPPVSAVSALTADIPEKGIPAPIYIDTDNEVLLDCLGQPGWIIGQRVLNMDTGKNLGFLFLTISKTTLSEGIPTGNENSLSGAYELVKADGTVAASSDQERLSGSTWDLSGFATHTGQGAGEYRSWLRFPYIYKTYAFEGGGWYLVNRMSFMILLWIFVVIILIFAVLELLFLQVSRYLVGKTALQLSEPIEELTNMALRVGEGETTLRCDIRSDDEIGTLGQVFNEMLDKMQVMSNEMEAAQEQKRSYELELLQQQIKPHFLYNTLDLIYIYSLMGNNESAAEVVLNLADFYRTSLSDGAGVVTMASETKNITSYLKIQKERFTNKFDYEIDIAEDIMDCRIPKLTLQPLVENAINHGIRPTGRHGSVCIQGRGEEDCIILEVRDTGAGMSAEMVEEILSDYRKEEQGHFGLGSTNRRLKLFFGEEYGMDIESTPGEGTTVRIRIPKEV